MKQTSRNVSLGFLFVSEEHFPGFEAQKSRVYEDVFASKPQEPGWGEQGRCVRVNDTDILLNTDSTDKHEFRAKKRKISDFIGEQCHTDDTDDTDYLNEHG